MKAAVIEAYGLPEKLKIVEQPIPDVLHPQDVIVKVHYSCVNPVDCKIRNGNHKLWLRLKMSATLGFDFSGEITAKGSNVRDLNLGDFVYGLGSYLPGGAYAEYIRTSSQELVKIDSNMVREHAAAAMAGGTALVAFHKLGDMKDKKILIHGAGSGVGHLAMQMAKLRGAQVYAVCSSRHAEILQYAKPYRHFDYEKEDYRKSNILFDYFFDVVGTAKYPEVKQLIAKGGAYINLLPRPMILVYKLMGFLKSQRVITFLFRPKRKVLNELSVLIRNQQIKVFIDSEYPLLEIVKAHERSERHEASGKILIKIAE